VVRRQIDRDKLRAAIRRLDEESAFRMLDAAIDLLPEAKLRQVVKPHLQLDKVLSDGQEKTSLLEDVKTFEKASLAGEYYDHFKVNSQNYMKKSTGTVAWITQCNRLLARCVAAAKTDDPGEVRQVFDVIFGLLDRIDDGDDIIFFADEAGSWQVGVDWDEVLPAWCTVLSATTAPDEYAECVLSLVKQHCDYDRDKMLELARNAATPAQRQALA
jgi:hypothetical protein